MAPMTKAGRVSRLARLLPQGGAVAKEVELAERDPAGYARRFAKRLDARDISLPERRLAWFALVDGLIARRAGAEIDRRELVEDWLANVRRMVPAGVRKALPSKKELEALSPAENDVLLDVVSDRLAARGWRLLQIELGHDGYPIAAVPARQAETLVAAARAAGGRVTVKGGADLAKLERAHQAEVAAEQRSEQRQQRERQAGGPAWQKLVAKEEFWLVVFGLENADAAEQRLFIKAAAEAPKPYRERAQNLAALMVDPVGAGKRLDPRLAFVLMKRLPQDPRSIASRVRALAVIAKRIRLGADAKATKAFLHACRFYTRPENIRAARRAAPLDAKRWKRIAEERYLASKSWDAAIALHWLGDRDTLALLAARGNKADKELHRDITAALR
jgi:hypothetical protein